NQGYYDVDVDIHTAPPQNDLETIQYVISKGQRYRLVRIAFTGNTYFTNDIFLDRMYLQTKGLLVLRHGRFSEALLNKDEENLTNLYLANGFRDAKVTANVDRNYQGKTGDVSVTVNVNEGPQWRVDTVTLNGVTQFPKKALLDRLSSIPGQPFADVNMAADRNDL